MSSSIWTPAELSSSVTPLSGRCWRAVEAQHHVSTMKLTDSLEEQAILENIVEESKPPIPPGCEGLDFLMMTPFRYSIRNPWGSRFRRPHSPKGVFYASEHPNTAIAEMAFHRLLFFAESPQTPWPRNPGEYTAFATEFGSDRVLDLNVEPYVADASIFDLTTYTGGQALAEIARNAHIEVIKYPSVRDPNGWSNLALLEPGVFTKPEPVERQSWRLHLDENGARAVCESPRFSLSFPKTAFDNDPRMSGFNWHR
jgi:RES domain